jgi:hypothetical protein
MATTAKARIADVVTLEGKVRRCRGMHHGLVPFVDREGPILRALAVLVRLRDDYIADEGCLRPQTRLLNLVAN